MTKYSDPCQDPAVQAELDTIIEKADSPIRYAVVFALTKRSNGFYDFSNGFWEWNRVPDVVLFKDREIAEAVAAVLTEQRQQRGKKSVIFPGKSRPLQTVALRKTAKGCVFLEKIRGRHGAYKPGLPLSSHAKLPSTKSS
jgi:hypothetical protein